MTSPSIEDKTSSISEQDVRFWWNTISLPLISLMQSAGYSPEDQLKYADFVRCIIPPNLGPKPKDLLSPYFDSFCNDDFSPVELSWNLHGSKSTVRIGFEPIGPSAGTLEDPFNQFQMEQVVDTLLSKFFDSELWQHFRKLVSVDKSDIDDIVAKMAPNEHMSTNTISFDLGRDMVPKIYFYPVAKSLLTGMSVSDIVCFAIERLSVGIRPPLKAIQDFISEFQSASKYDGVKMECFSFDAVKPADSRLKLYLRTPGTSLAETKDIYTLGGRLQGKDVDVALIDLDAFWRIVLDQTDPAQELPRSTHRTAGIIFNFELRHGMPKPSPKVYIPVRHYGKNDLDIAQRLSSFLRLRGWTGVADSYLNDVRKTFPTQDFAQSIDDTHTLVCHTKTVSPTRRYTTTPCYLQEETNATVTVNC